LGREFRDVHKGCRPDVPVFDCPMETLENLNCLFLEMLASFAGAGVVNGLDLLSCFGPESPLNGADGALVRTAQVFREALGETYRWHLQEGKRRAEQRQRATPAAPAGPAFADPFADPRALVQRHWYSTCRQTAFEASEDCPWHNFGFEVQRLPGDVWTCGDWHLGILEGSVGVRSGVSLLLDEFLTPAAATARLVQGVGLPPYRDFYTADGPEGEMPVLRVPPSWFRPYVDGTGKVIHRSAIHGYRQAAPILNGYLHYLLSNPAGDDAWLRGLFLSMHGVLRKLNPSSSQAAK
jgi:hypothetical protein